MSAIAAPRPRLDDRLRSAWAAVETPVKVWLVWRIVHAVLLVAFGGHVVGAIFAFDGNWYRRVLDHGYSLTGPYTTEQDVAFFPGLPWLTEPFSWVLGSRRASFLVATVSGLTAFVAVHAAIDAIAGSVVARRAVIALALCPASVFLWAYYTEGLFLTATGVAIWASGRDRPLPAVAGLFVAGLTRPIGFVLGPILAVTRVYRTRRIDAVAVAYGVAGPAGLGLVALAQERAVGDPLAFAKAQGAWGRELSGPWEPFLMAIEHEQHRGPALELTMNLLAVVVVAVALVVVSRRWWGRGDAQPAVMWGWVAWLAPLCSTLLSSQVRFALGAWPALMAVGTGESARGRLVRGALALVAVVLSVVTIRQWTRLEFIG